MAIKRDQWDIICQHSELDGAYMDGGDSARSTGIMAVAGSKDDKNNLTLFEYKIGTITRHPYQPPWNNPKNFTRDQLIPFMAGCYFAGANNVAKRTFTETRKRWFRAQNTEKDVVGSTKQWPDGADLLSPSDVLFLAVSSRASYPVLFLTSIIGIPWFLLTLLWTTKIKPDDEQNQIICQCLTFGRLATKIYVKLHPNYKKSLFSYWAGWRDQREIAVAVAIKIETVLRGT